MKSELPTIRSKAHNPNKKLLFI